jgi:hypothetical protein
MARESWARKNLEMDFRQPTYMHMPGPAQNARRKNKMRIQLPALLVCAAISHPAGDEVLRQIAGSCVWREPA